MNQILLPLTIWSLKRAKQWLCVNSKIDLQMYLRLWLKPCLLDPSEIYRICGLDIKVNLVFNQLYNHMNHLSKKGLYKVWENLLLTLYVISGRIGSSWTLNIPGRWLVSHCQAICRWVNSLILSSMTFQFEVFKSPWLN